MADHGIFFFLFFLFRSWKGIHNRSSVSGQYDHFGRSDHSCRGEL